MQKLYTTGRIGNSHSDLCMIVADLSESTLEEIVIEKDSDAEKQLAK